MANKKRTRFIDATHAPWNQQHYRLGGRKSPTPEEILGYIKNETIATLETGDELDYDWDEIRTYHLRASLKLITGNIPEICWAFFNLGSLHERLQHLTSSELLEISGSHMDDLRRLKELELAEMTRQLPFKLKNFAIEIVKETAQEIASKLWKEDLDERIRITEMVETVYPKLVAEIELGISKHIDLIKDGDIASAIRKAIPSKPGGLKGWLRETAPSYSGNRGRRKNNP